MFWTKWLGVMNVTLRRQRSMVTSTQDHNGGSCCVTRLIRNGNLVVSNASDFRVVISKKGMAEVLTSEHKPSREDERDKIETRVSNQEAIDITHPFYVGNN
ncbi:putative protein phosphatase 2C 2 [Glycine max]|nr:putative protein phosphatase 2C 2 [Glycine max]